MDDTDRFDLALLEALVLGFRARAGAKERFQALSEYEIARRLGIVEGGYVEYDDSRERERVRAALSRLQRRGMVRVMAVSGRYETFVPLEGFDAFVGDGEGVAPSDIEIRVVGSPAS